MSGAYLAAVLHESHRQHLRRVVVIVHDEHSQRRLFFQGTHSFTVRLRRQQPRAMTTSLKKVGDSPRWQLAVAANPAALMSGWEPRRRLRVERAWRSARFDRCDRVVEL